MFTTSLNTPPVYPPVGSVSGKAYLIGAGPGQADLITVRGLRLIRQAEVVLYDRLIPQELLEEISPTAEQIFVGKLPGQHARPQKEINRLLVEYVRAGKQVVRLKGGDPFVFGRGGEEALALHEAGLPFEIVPGISSAIAVPALAGIPVTHRGLSTGFAVITGHEDPTKPRSMTDWWRLAHVPTLVILMGVKNFATIAEKIMEAGRPGSTPAGVISHGATKDQRVVIGTLETLAGQMSQEKISSPAIIIVGEVVSLHQSLDWFRPSAELAGFVPVESEEE